MMIKIVVEKGIELCDQITAAVFPGDKLTFVKPVGIIKQEIDLRKNDLLRMFVDKFGFLAYFFQQILYDAFFSRREMQRFVY
jgi:hypothetical protein